MDEELPIGRIQNPSFVDSEREVIAHLFDVLFKALDAAKLVPDNVCLHCLDEELRKLRNGHENEG